MKTHPLNVSYLVVGLVFLGISGSWALGESGVIDLGAMLWLVPLTLVAAGLVGLGAFAAKGALRRRKAAVGPHEELRDEDALAHLDTPWQTSTMNPKEKPDE